jgi:hypothetical protein
VYNERALGFGRSALVWIALVTGGCGGGGGGSSPVTQQPPAIPPAAPPPPPPPSDTIAPDTSITGAPSSVSSSNTAAFVATASEAGATFEASVDSGPFNPTSIPLQLSGLADGTHTVSFRARDAASNVDATPAVFTWLVDTTAPTAKILFPPPNSYTDATTLTIRGTASDANGIASVHVNDIAASSSDGFQSWTAVIPIHPGQTDVLVSSTDAAGNTSPSVASASVSNRGPVIGQFAGVGFDSSTNKLVIADNSSSSLYAFDAVTGFGTQLASYPSPHGSLSAIAIEQSPHRAIVMDDSRDTLASIDLTTGTTTDISQSDPTVHLYNVASIVIDKVNHRALVATNSSIVAIDLNTGARTVISNSGLGSGPFFTTTPVIVLDVATNPSVPRVVGVGNVGGASVEVFTVNLANGNRQVLSPSDSISPAILIPKSAELDPSTHRLMVSDFGSGSLLAVDLVTGNRSIVSGTSVGSGPTIAPSTGLALTSEGKAFVADQHGEVVSIDLSTGTRQTVIHSRLGAGPRLGSTAKLVIEQASGTPESLLVLEGGRLARISLATGDRTVLSSSTLGTGPFSTGFTALALDKRPNTGNPSALAIFALTSELVSIDLTNGNRTLVANLGLSGSANLQRDLQLDAAANRVYWTNLDLTGTPNPAVYSYDLANSQRTTISDNTVGSGAPLKSPGNLLLDAALSRILVSDQQLPGIVAVDVHSGNREAFAPDPNIKFSAGPMYLDALHSRIIGVNYRPSANLFAIDLPDGTHRRILSGPDSTYTTVRGSGPGEFFSSGFDVDSPSDVAYLPKSDADGVLAVDLVSGDRVLISR